MKNDREDDQVLTGHSHTGSEVGQKRYQMGAAFRTCSQHNGSDRYTRLKCAREQLSSGIQECSEPQRHKHFYSVLFNLLQYAQFLDQNLARGGRGLAKAKLPL